MMVLNLQALSYGTVSANLPNANHHAPQFRALNPQGLVPVLEIDDSVCRRLLRLPIRWRCTPISEICR